jgi:hypothetical protein
MINEAVEGNGKVKNNITNAYWQVGEPKLND